MVSFQDLMNSSNPPGISCTQVSQMSSGKLWPKLSDLPDEPSEIRKFVNIPRHVTSSQPEIKPIDFTHKIDENPIDINPVESFDFYIKRTSINRAKISDLNLKSMLRNVRDISNQDIPIRTPSVPTASRLKQNYVEFQQSYTGILDEVKHEVEQARSLDSDIEKIKNETYDEFAVVMEEIYNAGVSMPEVTWNEDGSLDVGWSLKTGGTSTILVYGDDHVIYNTYLGADNYVESICKISDGLLLPKLVGILSNITE